MNHKIEVLEDENIDLPISLPEAKKFIKIYHDEDDQTIEMMLLSAAKIIEDMAGVSLLQKKYRLNITYLPNKIPLVPIPYNSIVAFEYFHDTEQIWKSISSNRYFVVKENENTFITPSNLTSTYQDYISDLDEYIQYPVRVDYLAGYGTSINVPPNVKLAILNVLYDIYSKKECPECEMMLSSSSLFFIQQIAPTNLDITYLMNEV